MDEILPNIQGEEIGMLDNYDISWDQTTDPAALNGNPQTYMETSRDPERTPFQWNSDINAGKDKSVIEVFIKISSECYLQVMRMK